MSTQKKTQRSKQNIKPQNNGVEDARQVEELVEVIDRLPEKKKAQLISKVSMQYSGPLPMALEFGKYEEITPGAGDRILGMAERQSQHRQELEKHAVLSQFRLAGKGQWFGFVLGLVGLIGGFYLISIDKDATGIASLVGTVSAFAGAYIYGNKKKQS